MLVPLILTPGRVSYTYEMGSLIDLTKYFIVDNTISGAYLSLANGFL